MKISSKGRHAVRIMAEIAKKNQLTSVAEISQSQDIPVKYLEQIINKLVKAELLISVRGAQGGYKLAKPTSEYSVAEILRVTGDMPALAPCLENDVACPRVKECESLSVWDTLSKLIYDYLKDISLQDLLNKKV